jgi:hypothetical protein
MSSIMSLFASQSRTSWRRALLLPVLLGLSACGIRAPSLSVPSPGELTTRVRTLLSSDDRSLDFRRARVELEELGPDVDTALVSIAYDPAARGVVRANALLLLAERRAPDALAALQWALFNANDEVIREAAVLGLNRYVTESAEAQNAIRSAVADPSPRVRLNALQSLDVHDINAIRSLLRTERHPLVREIAVQYLAISESRGAPLLAEANGVFRTAGLEEQPRLVLHPDTADARFGYVRGELGVEWPGGEYLPLAYDVEMVHHVLPAFLSPDRSIAVIEAGRHIMLRDLDRREAVFLGAGLAPRAIPFSDAFVFLREQPEVRRAGGAPDRVYEVYRATFNGSVPERLGEMRITISPNPEEPFSPVRWMAVGESPEGWVIKIDGTPVFQAPHRTGGGEEQGEG